MKNIIETLFKDADDIVTNLPEQIHPAPDKEKGKLFFEEFEDTNERLEILYRGSGMLALKAARVKVTYPTDNKLDKHGNLNMTILEVGKDSASITYGQNIYPVTTYSEGQVSLEATQVDISKTVNGIAIASRMIDDVIQTAKKNESE